LHNLQFFRSKLSSGEITIKNFEKECDYIINEIDSFQEVEALRNLADLYAKSSDEDEE
jgi:hypothetical protein